MKIGLRTKDSKLLLYENMAARLSQETGLIVPIDGRLQQKFIEEHVIHIQNQHLTEVQKKAASYLYSRLKEVTDPYLKFEVCKINEISKRKYQPQSSLIE